MLLCITGSRFIYLISTASYSRTSVFDAISHPCLTCSLAPLPSPSHTSSLHLTGDAAFLVLTHPSAFAAQMPTGGVPLVCLLAISIGDYWYAVSSCARWYDGTSGVFVFPKVHMSSFGCFLSFLGICC